jgi:sulfopyruvate decarboxylase subunit beta
MTSALLRTEAVAAFARSRGDMLTVVTMQAVGPWNALGQADSRNFNVTGSMGSAGAIGLGLALARPDERVLVLDGDGSLLMQLGTLASVAEQQPPNLYHAVFENGIYETSGGQALPGHSQADLLDVARAAGYRYARRFSDTRQLDEGLNAALRVTGPVFLSVIIVGPGAVTRPTPSVHSKAAQIDNMRTMLQGDAR